MTRIVLAIALLALAQSAIAADPPPPPSSSSQSMSSSPKPPKPKTKAAPPKISEADERLLAVTYAKNKFMAAMGSCPKPEDCDPSSPRKNAELITMLKGAEDGFMEACAQCATDKDCEQERDKIRSGRGRFGYNVCVAKAAKPADKKPAAKPAAAPAPAPSK